MILLDFCMDRELPAGLFEPNYSSWWPWHMQTVNDLGDGIASTNALLAAGKEVAGNGG